MNETIARLITEFGPEPGIGPLYAAGWESIGRDELCIIAKRPYLRGDTWPEGFAELVDNRIVYHGYYGNTLVAPAEYQPENIADFETRRKRYHEIFPRLALQTETAISEVGSEDVVWARNALLDTAAQCPQGTNKDKWLPYVRLACAFWTLKERHCFDMDATSGAFQATSQKLLFEKEFEELTGKKFDFSTDSKES